MPAWVAAGAAVAGTALSAYGQYSSGQAGAASSKYQATVARNNAAIAQSDADLANQQAQQQAGTDAVQGALRLGAQRAAIGASGAAITSGSAQSVLTSTARATEAQTIGDVYAGALKAYAYEAQGTGFNAQAGLDTMAASNAAEAGDLGIGTSLASGASSVSRIWMDYNRGTAGAGPQQGGLY